MSGPFGFPNADALSGLSDEELAGPDEPGVPPEETTEEAEPEAPEAQEAEAAPQPGEPGYRWAAKYEDPQQLEQGYRELNARFTQLSQTQAERDRAAQARIQELENGLQQAMPYIQAGMAQVGPGGQPRSLSADEVDFDDPQQLNAYLEAKITERMQPILAQMQAQTQQQVQTTQQQAYVQQAEVAITQFRQAHPDVAGTAVEDEMATIVNQFGLDLRDPEQIDFAYQVWQNPAIGEAVRANPIRATSPQGRREAQMLAPQFAAPGLPGTPAAPQAGRGVKRPRPVAHVETGGSGAPVAGAPGERQAGQRDAFDEVLDLLDRSKPSPFGLRVPR